MHYKYRVNFESYGRGAANRGIVYGDPQGEVVITAKDDDDAWQQLLSSLPDQYRPRDPRPLAGRSYLRVGRGPARVEVGDVVTLKQPAKLGGLRYKYGRVVEEVGEEFVGLHLFTRWDGDYYRGPGQAYGLVTVDYRRGDVSPSK